MITAPNTYVIEDHGRQCRFASPRDPSAWADKWDKNWHILETVLLGEDFPLLRGIQRAYANQAASPTILGRNEVLNQAFHREVARLRG